jgi:hypothetical protein
MDACRLDLTHDLRIQIGVFCVGLFLACMFCHGELVRPNPRCVSHAVLPHDLARRHIGAALVGIVAPLVLPAGFELAGALAFCALLLLWQARREPLVYSVLNVAALWWRSAAACGE